LEIGVIENSLLKTNINHVSSAEISQGSVYVSHDASSKIGVLKSASEQAGSTEVGITNDGIADITVMHKNSSQIRTREVNSNHTNLLEISSPQVDVSQNNSFEVDSRVMRGRTVGVDKFDSSEVTLPVVVPNQQFFRSDFPSHNLASNFVSNIKNSATSIPDSHWVSSLNLTYALGDRTDIGSFGGQNIEPEAIYGIKSTNIPLINILTVIGFRLSTQPTRSAITLKNSATNIPDSHWVSSLNLTYALGDRTVVGAIRESPLQDRMFFIWNDYNS
jgi:hypothetical protein